VKDLFGRIRWRLVGWTMLILGLILVMLGATVYGALSRSLLDEVDRSLLSSSQQALPTLLGPSGASGRASNREPLGGRDGYRGGVFYLHLDPSGQILANPQHVAISGVIWPALVGPSPTFGTLTLNDDPTRVLVQQAPDGDLLIVGQSLQPEQTALHFLLLVLVAGGGVGLLLSLGGAWFLAGRALVPIQRAFGRQQEFIADASHEMRTPLTVLRAATLAGDASTPPVEADPDRLQQVLLILVDNAVKHTPSGGNVQVRVGHRGGSAVLEVEDTGAGIPAEHLPRIFDRFYRADQARSEGGTGLGLAIAKMLVEAHRGHLVLTSKPGVGTRATVYLPLTLQQVSLGSRLGGLAAHVAAHASIRP
jgi:hypothetical protein